MNYYEPTVVIKKESKINKLLLSPISVAVSVFCICLSFSYKILTSNLEDKNNQIFNTKFTQINSEIKKYERLLRNISSYLEVNGDISPNDFIKYTESFDIKNDYPALLRVDYLNMVTGIEENNLFYNNLKIDYENLDFYLEHQPKILEMIEKNKIINEKRNLFSKEPKNIIVKYTYPTVENAALIGEEYFYIDKETFEKNSFSIFSSYTFKGLVNNQNNEAKSYKTNILKKIKGNNSPAISLTIEFSKYLFNKQNKDGKYIGEKDISIKLLSSKKDGKRVVYSNKVKDDIYQFMKTAEIMIGNDRYELQIGSSRSIFSNKDYIQALILSLAFSLLFFLIMKKLARQKKSDVVLDRKAIEDIESQLRTDDLTKLLNRRACQQDLKSLIKNYSLKKNLDDTNESNPSVHLVFIDLDGFKRINYTLGHSYGDTVLVEYGSRLKELLGNIEGISFYRFDGDEFTVIIDGHIKEDVKNIVEKISDLTKEPFSLRKENYYVTQSIGVAAYPNDAKNTETLLKNADIAMYEAKKSGKICFVFFNKKISEAVDKKNKVINNINEALEKNEFYMVYQPKIKYISSGKYTCSGVEALIRWENSKLGNVRPDVFIPVIEEHGLIGEVTNWILNKICEECQILKNIKDFKISINLSAKQLNNLNLAKEFSDTIAKYGLKNEMFIIEITETTMMKNSSVTKINLDNFNKLGFSISVDDFGTGYSSLSYLRNFPVDELKIDKSFTDMVLNDLQTQVIVDGIMHMCKKLEMGIVIEGVETIEQIKWFEEKLVNNQSIEIQGYYFSKPLVINDLINFGFKKNN